MWFYREEQANLIKNVVLVAGKKKNVFHHLVHHPSVFFKHVFLLIDHERSSGIDVLFSQSAAPSDSAAVEGPGPSVKQ